MKAAIAGLKNVSFAEFEKYLPKNVTEIVWTGNNKLLEEYAKRKRIKLIKLSPDFDTYSNSAHLKMNLDIVKTVDVIIAFWDDENAYTKFIVDECQKNNTNLIVVNRQ